MSIGLFEYNVVKPLSAIGLSGDFWALHLDTLIATWVAMGFLIILCILGRWCISKECNLLSVAYEQTFSVFTSLCKNTAGILDYRSFAFVSTIFFFTLFCCWVGVLPFKMHEATTDINTTLAIALCSFTYVQYRKIRAHGIKEYLKEFIDPFFMLAPIHVVGELSKIASMAFRLFGNILGGSVIILMGFKVADAYQWYFLCVLGLVLLLALIARLTKLSVHYGIIHSCLTMALTPFFILPMVQITFGVLEPLLQSFVLTMLTATYLSMGTQDLDEHDQPKELTL